MAAEGLDPVPAPGGGQQQATAAPSNAVLAAATRVKGAATALLAQAKPWSELADRSAFSKPGDLAEVGGDWGSLQRQENAKMRHRFFFFCKGSADVFFSLFFFRKKEREQHRFSRGHARLRPRNGISRGVESECERFLSRLVLKHARIGRSEEELEATSLDGRERERRWRAFSTGVGRRNQGVKKIRGALNLVYFRSLSLSLSLFHFIPFFGSANCFPCEATRTWRNSRPSPFEEQLTHQTRSFLSLFLSLSRNLKKTLNKKKKNF